jgi:transposase
MAFRGLSNIIDLNDDTIDMLGKYKTPEDFITAGNNAIMRYVTSRKAEKILKAAQSLPIPGNNINALRIEIDSLLDILKILNRQKGILEGAMTKELESRRHLIKSIPSIGNITT